MNGGDATEVFERMSHQTRVEILDALASAQAAGHPVTATAPNSRAATAMLELADAVERATAPRVGVA